MPLHEFHYCLLCFQSGSIFNRLSGKKRAAPVSTSVLDALDDDDDDATAAAGDALKYAGVLKGGRAPKRKKISVTVQREPSLELRLGALHVPLLNLLFMLRY